MKIQNVKGGYDFLPKEQKIRNYINGILKNIFEKYGYKSIETPILCYYEILSDKYDSNNDILKEIYKLNDQGNRALGLRYDLTVPFAKFIALNKNKITFPFKRYEISKVFRDGPVKVGRDREFTQCDVDIVGIEGQLIEAELMTLYVKAFNKLDIDIIIKYNSRNLMNGLIIECGIDNKLIGAVTTIIDKLDKISKEEFENSLLDLNLSKKQISFLLENFKMNLNELTIKYKETTNEYIKLGLDELNQLTINLNELEILNLCEFSSTLARGQNYYTGNVFEVYDKNKKVSGSIGAGGRYDKMITNFINDGCSYPTVGISFGLSSIYEILKDRKNFENKSDVDIYIIPLNTNVESLKLANKLRDIGVKVEVEMQNRKLKKSLNYANKEIIPFVIILGEEEIKKEEFKLKDMYNSKEYNIKFNNLLEISRKITNS